MNTLLHKEKQKKIIIILDNLVYDLTDFVDIHPGGTMVIQDSVGQDSEKLFYSIEAHNTDWVRNQLKKYCIGPVESLPLVD
jgi:cytochrome b involved in lipid metabolism